MYKTYAANSGKFHLISQRLHDTYGPVVRIGPNHLSYASITALRTIYSHPQGSSGIWTKSGQYDVDKEFAETNLVTERDPVKHGRMRKLFANVFSSKALGEQEDLVQRYVDLLMHQLGKYGAPKSKLEREASSGDGPNGADILQFFNWATFDIIGDLAFGRSFGSLAAGTFCLAVGYRVGDFLFLFFWLTPDGLHL